MRDGEGHVLGIDPGYSDRDTTAFCLLTWDAAGIQWQCERTNRSIASRRTLLKRLVPAAEHLAAVAIDGPLRPGLQFDATTYRAAEAALSGGVFHKRGKPGAIHCAGGPALHREATDLARLCRDELGVDPKNIYETFPNFFLGFLCLDQDYPDSTIVKRRWTDRLYPLCVQALSRTFGTQTIHTSLDIRHHDDIAAFVCAIAAFCAAHKQGSLVGSEQDGLILLPPGNLWQAWVDPVLRRNLDRCRLRFPDVILKSLHVDRNIDP